MLEHAHTPHPPPVPGRAFPTAGVGGARGPGSRGLALQPPQGGAREAQVVLPFCHSAKLPSSVKL